MLRYHIPAKQTKGWIADMVVEFFSDHEIAEVSFSMEYKTETSLQLQVHSSHKPVMAVLSKDFQRKVVDLPGGETFDSIVELPFRIEDPNAKWSYSPCTCASEKECSIWNLQKMQVCTRQYWIDAIQTSTDVVGLFMEFYSCNRDISKSKLKFSVNYETEKSVRFQVHKPYKAITAVFSNGFQKKVSVNLPGGESFDAVVTLPFYIRNVKAIKPDDLCPGSCENRKDLLLFYASNSFNDVA